MTIETATEIYTEVNSKVVDSSFDVDDTISFINKGIKEIAGAVLLPKLLETDTTIISVVDKAYASLPSNFMKHLHFCYSDTNYRKIKIYDSLELLYADFGKLDVGGNVVGVTRRGDRLYYQRIPAAAETLRIHYYKYPTELTIGTSKPDCLPEFLVRPLLVNYVLKEEYAVTEQGFEGRKIDTEHYEGKYLTAFADLVAYIGPEDRVPQMVNDTLNLEMYL